MLDVKLSPDKRSKEILKDSDDELAVKTRKSNSEDTSNEDHNTEAMGVSSFLLPFILFFFLFLLLYIHFLFGVFPFLPCMSPYYAVTEALEDPKATTVFAEPTTPTPTSPGKFTFHFSSSFLCLLSFTCTHYFHSFILLCLRLTCYWSLGLLPTKCIQGVVFGNKSFLPLPLTPWRRPLHFLFASSKWREMILTWWTSRALGLPMWTFMDSGYLRIAWSICKLFIMTMGVLCRDFPLAILLKSISSSFWDVLWMIFSTKWI